MGADSGDIEEDLLEVKAFVNYYQGNSVFVFTEWLCVQWPRRVWCLCGSYHSTRHLKQWERKLTPLPINFTASSLDYKLLYNTVDPIQTVTLQNASFVLCDSLQAVHFVTEGSEYWRKTEWLKKLLSLQDELWDINVSVYLLRYCRSGYREVNQYFAISGAK